MKNQNNEHEKPDSASSRMDDACYSPNASATDQFLARKAYHKTYLSDLRGSERIERKIAEENS